MPAVVHRGLFSPGRRGGRARAGFLPAPPLPERPRRQSHVARERSRRGVSRCSVARLPAGDCEPGLLSERAGGDRLLGAGGVGDLGDYEGRSPPRCWGASQAPPPGFVGIPRSVPGEGERASPMRGPGRLGRWALVPMLLVLSAGRSRGLSFYLPPQGRKCLKEELHGGVMVTGEYQVSEAAAPGIQTDLKVTDSSGHLLYSREEAKKGKFAFTTEDYEVYEICFQSHGQPGNSQLPDQLVNLNVKHGVEALNYENVAKAEKLKPLELDLRRLEDLSESIVKDFAFMKQWEEEMRDTNESTSTRVFYFGLFSMLCLVSLATWQIFYLRRFFKAKKLIA